MERESKSERGWFRRWFRKRRRRRRGAVCCVAMSGSPAPGASV
jgi:hypothetical protein